MSIAGPETHFGSEVDRAREVTQEYLRQGREKVEDLTSNVEGMIRNQPGQALLVAAAVGFVLGACFMRR
jgi:ElaB/YqjD/DUF883 family membrane-anchored ribosome-binding protein